MAQIITALTWQKKNKKRINVDIDNQFAFGLSIDLASKLHVGDAISAEEIKHLLKLDQHEIAYQYGLRLLSFRERSTGELADRFRRQGFDPETIDAAIERLVRNGLVSDERFAITWVDNRATFRPRSHRFLRYELGRKRIAPDIIQSALSHAADDVQLAVLAAKRFSPRIDKNSYEIFRSKLAGYLLRRGFSYATTNEVIKTTWQEIEKTRGKLC